jgi:hypothetical protein
MNALFKIYGSANESARAMTKPSFVHGVVSIIGMRSQKKMLRVATNPIVALMTHKHTIGNWSLGNFKRHAVRQQGTKITGGFSISVLADGTSPRPTRIRAAGGDTMAKSLLERWCFGPSNLCAQATNATVIAHNKLINLGGGRCQ